MKRLLPLLLLPLAACQTVSLPEGLSFARPKDEAPVPGVVIDSLPTGATLTYPHGECLTPCRIDYGMTVEVQIAKLGYRPVRLTVPLGAKDAVIELRPVGRSTAVEEESLPPL
ncbi:hypothetical protein [Parvularcula maris]|uniref:PEGA domain-containing protein n=1 Tax=Parvularcula maris TaxID=2965077 RepID=A0A9X2RHW3_9PROT|nr:hypothetical protein [Parvularcula maris]MCQ8185309.1 hypothetical protein [Parvularcula maris]